MTLTKDLQEALENVESAIELTRHNEYEHYLHDALSTAKYELERQLTNLLSNDIIQQ